jgi:hypothetical protein
VISTDWCLKMNRTLVTVPIERVEKAILLIRGEKVMLDRDLAALYDIPTKVLKQAVRRTSTDFQMTSWLCLISRNSWRGGHNL